MDAINSLTTAQMLAVFNHYADKPVSRFATPAIGRTRLVKLLATIDAPEAQAIKAVLAPAPVKTKAAKSAKVAKAAKPTTIHLAADDAKAPAGAKARILEMIARKGGVSEPEVCAALGWPRAGGTISRAIKVAPFKVAKVKGDDGRTRYFRA